MASPNSTSSGVNRREFLGNSARNAASVAAGVLSLGMSTGTRQPGPLDSVHVGVIGLGEQGRDLTLQLGKIPGVRIVAICDVDAHVLAAAQHEIMDQTGHRPAIVVPHEQLLARSDVDAVVIATPDHWHASMAIAACQAEKDVYLEQPVGHSIADGQAILKAAREHRRIVQTGLPQRSGLHFQSAIDLLRSGEIGRVHLAKAWAVHRRRSIGRVASSPAPAGVDYRRWLGPTGDRPFNVNHFHQNWPWFWEFGAGELGLWGVQLLDVVRWGLDLDLPSRVIACGGQRAFHDDRETPDTLTVQYEFPEVDVVWEHRQWSSRGIEGRTAAVAFYGEHGTLIVDRSGWKVYDGRPGLFAETSEIRQSHLRNWIDCIRTRQLPAADIAIGERSMLMCHLGNISYRLGREVRFRPDTLSFDSDDEANRLLRGPNSVT